MSEAAPLFNYSEPITDAEYHQPHLSILPSVDAGLHEDDGETFVIEPPPVIVKPFSPRHHQKATVEAVKKAISLKNPARIRRPLVVKATGVGKTIDMALLAQMANSKGFDCLWLIPSGPRISSLVTQGLKAMADVGSYALVEKASQDALPQYYQNLEDGVGQTIVASVPTLQGPRLERWVSVLRDPVILIDEAHHAPAQTVRNILKQWPRAVVIGFTATPKRGDGVSLSTVFQPASPESIYTFEYPLAKAVKDGWLVPPLDCPILPDPPLDLKKIRITSDGDFDNDELEAIIIENMERLVSYAKPALIGKRWLAFFPDIRSAHAGAEAFKQVGLRTAYVASKDAVTGKPMSTEQQNKIIQSFEDGEYDGLCNPIMLAEGFDKTFIDCIAIFRMTRNISMFAQMVGRGTRLHDGKDACLVLRFQHDGPEVASLIDLYDDSEHSDEVVERAKKIMGERRERDPQRALEIAEEEHQIDLSKTLQLKERAVSYEYKIYDPLKAMELIGMKQKADNDKWYNHIPADPYDKTWLDNHFNKTARKLGKPDEVDVESLSFYAAKQMKSKALERIKKGLCNHRQMALLIAKGMPPQEAAKVKFKDVSSALAALGYERNGLRQ